MTKAPDHTDVFDTFAADRGGQVYSTDDPRDRTVPFVIQLFKEMADRIELHQNPGAKRINLAVGYFDNPGFNACASEFDGFDIIGVDFGVPNRLLFLFVHLLTVVGTFPNIDPRPPMPLGYTVNSAMLAEAGKFSSFEAWPRFGGGDRARLVVDLTHIAERFFLLHELAHIANGHLDWIKSKFGVQVFDELRASDIDGLSSISRQTLEWDADCFAVQQLLVDIAGATTRTEGTHRLSNFPERNRFGGIGDALKILAFANYTCHRARASPEIGDLTEVIKNSHPPALMRMISNIQQVSTVLTKAGGFDEGQFDQFFEDGTLEADFAWSEITGQPRLFPLSPSSSEAYFELKEMLAKEWDVLRPELAPYARLGKLAPARTALPQ